jgi:hypothetical protein
MAGKRTASGQRRFFNDHLLSAPRYLWWLRQILSRFCGLNDHENSITDKTQR